MSKKLYPVSGPTPLESFQLHINSATDFGYQQKVDGESPEDTSGFTFSKKGDVFQMSIHKIKTSRFSENYTKHTAVTWISRDDAILLAQEIIKSL